MAIAVRSFRSTFLRSSIHSESYETYDIYARPRSRLARADSRVPDCISVCTFARFQRTPRSTMLDPCSTDAHRSANQIGFAVHYKLIQSCRTLRGKSWKENSRKTRSNRVCVVTRSSRTGHRLKRYRQGAFAEWSVEDVYRPEGIVPGNHYCPSNFFTISMPLVTLPLCRGLRPSLAVEPGSFGSFFPRKLRLSSEIP